VSEISHALADPWSGEIMRRAALAVVLLGITGGATGCWIVLNGLSYGAESLPHAMFPGLVLASLGGVSLLLGGAGGLLLAALAIAGAQRTRGIETDTAVAVVVTTLFGLGTLLALSPATPAGVQALLFGDILGLTNGDLIAAGALATCAVVALRLVHARVLIASFDRAGAHGVGSSTALADLALLLLLAAAVLVAVPALGNLLVVALLVAPAATARLLARRVVPMMAMAAGIAIACGVAGLYASYYLRTAAGASIALVMVLVYAATSGVRRVA
jgi:ABC-type Mn2+/Zn2+ transport system permease subunit